MTCEYTWPNHLMATDQEATQALVDQHGLQGEVAYGRSKLFIRTPRTLVALEQERAQLVPIIVLLLQKVRWGGRAPEFPPQCWEGGGVERVNVSGSGSQDAREGSGVQGVWGGAEGIDSQDTWVLPPEQEGSRV